MAHLLKYLVLDGGCPLGLLELLAGMCIHTLWPELFLAHGGILQAPSCGIVFSNLASESLSVLPHAAFY